MYIGRVGQPDIPNLKLWLQQTDNRQQTDRGTSPPVEASLRDGLIRGHSFRLGVMAKFWFYLLNRKHVCFT